MQVFRAVRLEQPGEVFVRERISSQIETDMATDVLHAVVGMLARELPNVLHVTVDLGVTVTRVVGREGLPNPKPGEETPPADMRQ